MHQCNTGEGDDSLMMSKGIKNRVRLALQANDAFRVPVS